MRERKTLITVLGILLLVALITTWPQVINSADGLTTTSIGGTITITTTKYVTAVTTSTITFTKTVWSTETETLTHTMTLTHVTQNTVTETKTLKPTVTTYVTSCVTKHAAVTFTETLTVTTTKQYVPWDQVTVILLSAVILLAVAVAVALTRRGSPKKGSM